MKIEFRSTGLKALPNGPSANVGEHSPDGITGSQKTKSDYVNGGPYTR
jgi:hypothetical protein